MWKSTYSVGVQCALCIREAQKASLMCMYKAQCTIPANTGVQTPYILQFLNFIYKLSYVFVPTCTVYTILITVNLFLSVTNCLLFSLKMGCVTLETLLLYYTAISQYKHQ